MEQWRHASTIKANPDYAQLPVRTRALKDDKVLYIAVPEMATIKPFFLLSPDELKQPAEIAAEKNGAAQFGRRVGIEEMQAIDIAICGSVAVNRAGSRIGKGAGYSDLEMALLIEAELVTRDTVIVSPVHQFQIIVEEIPETAHDFSVDYIVTPDDVIACPTRRRPPGLVWDDLTSAKIEAIPILKARKHRMN
jgi:5-formyltetrahydrofolate cyclo-ligase